MSDPDDSSGFGLRQRYLNVTKFPIFDGNGLASHFGGIAIELPEPFTRG